MNAEETKSFIKKFYETLYEKFRDVSEVLIKIPIVEGNEPMWEEGSEPDKDGWVTWRFYFPAPIDPLKANRVQPILNRQFRPKL